MFWGTVIKEGKPYKTHSALEESDYPVLHISNVALPKSAGNGKVHLVASMGKDLKDLTLATLQKDKVETLALDLYVNVSQQVTLAIQGAGELHLSGFFEPQREEMEENMFDYGGEDEDEDEEEEEEVNGKKLNQSLKVAKQNALKNAHLSDEEEDDEDDDEDEEDEDEDSDDVIVPQPKAKAPQAPAQKAAQPVAAAKPGQQQQAGKQQVAQPTPAAAQQKKDQPQQKQQQK